MSNNYTSDEDEEEELYAEYEPDDPNNPLHPDHDLSDSYDYGWERPADTKPWYLQRWLFMIVGILVIISMVLPFLPRFY